MPRQNSTKLVDAGEHLFSLSSSVRPETMNLQELERRCLEEMHNYWHEGSGDEQYALEIFRRAMTLGDPLAWETLQRCFTGVVRLWMRRHAKREAAYALDSEENYIAQTFTRFWRASANNPELQFHTLAAALDYLRASLNGTIMDTLRAYSRPQEMPWPDPGYPLYANDGDLDTSNEHSELWEAIRHLLNDEHEIRLAYLHFHCGLKAREIVQFCPREFSDVQEVYRMRHNIFKRLMRNLDQLRWRLGSEEV